jgi:hypothetical protein
MAYREDEFEEDDGTEMTDREDPDQADQDESDEVETVACPNCGRQVAEDVAMCPYCRSFVSFEDAPRRRAPWWVVVGVVLCLLTALGWALSHG